MTTNSNTWNPSTYLEFADYRARPGMDLLSRIDLRVPGQIYDLGCGPGNLTQQVKARWPDRKVTGIDSSPTMLEKARALKADIAWQSGDISTWTPETPPALLFANAAFQWVPNHREVFPRLMRSVAPGGVLATQMPLTADAPYHHCLEKLLDTPRWHERLRGVPYHEHAWPAGSYYNLLIPYAKQIDVWETHYHHVLADIHAVTTWVSGTALTTYLAELRAEERQLFLDDYTDIASATYPARLDGKVLFTMRRLFIVAERNEKS